MSGGMPGRRNGDEPAVVEQICFPVKDLPFLFRESRNQLFSGRRFDFLTLDKTGNIAQFRQAAAMVAVRVGQDQVRHLFRRKSVLFQLPGQRVLRRHYGDIIRRFRDRHFRHLLSAIKEDQVPAMLNGKKGHRHLDPLRRDRLSRQQMPPCPDRSAFQNGKTHIRFALPVRRSSVTDHFCVLHAGKMMVLPLISAGRAKSMTRLWAVCPKGKPR